MRISNESIIEDDAQIWLMELSYGAEEAGVVA
jgi:hypothetical protein